MNPVDLEWGLAGAERLAAEADVSVVVDVLSFTTTLSVALEAGMTVFPYPWASAQAAAFAGERDAVLAVGRRAAAPGEVSLSPTSVRAARGIERLVLPSPNGSTIAHALGAGTLAASLRNRAAVATALVGVDRILLVPAGERWDDGSLRPAVEDLWGAGGVAAALEDAGRSLSEEAAAAAAAYRLVATRIAEALSACVSGQELIGYGFGDDVAVAAELDASHVVPRLREDGAFASCAGAAAETTT
ncbi:2-phosphosulfolactate phosphatase [Nocardioides mangrovicus]|uniref:Probable 2-phosphosulfolactate phosphatase n=1 Tax=Nocardioides mangrovicus TaxID=2478913 RepID=A0A3L8P8Y3_9ACTN|nr:2-phosphosulfolactate phosphatase [Nocardioides mangrovicus]RLV51048.1 2-phosphosulfolactate phosphatase [Nocardioides mangrovicus]